ncbi:hypothetical protein JD844_001956 [Phrynosoma platyrhinos]|uniref:Calcium-binding and coiled-coil domain-containing protein 2 n=1 Tax=Phrynosoma platyrhinos TaxID=52577 RepID=A0ABQ7TAL0_PHRPL|nr:hypothetical protein JD844_001956 [Phrynosoma platyrhinos]
MEAVPCNSSDEPPTSAVLLDTCHFSQVIFTNVEKFYIPGTDITCHYNLSQQVIPRRKDWVGIFRVGWKTTREYYTFMWAPLPSIPNSSGAEFQQVLFRAYYLPKDDEYYQFCYVDQDGQGEVEEIEQQNATLLHENQKLKAKQVSLQKQNKDLQEKLRVVEGEVEEIKQQNTAFFHENQKLKEKQVSLQEQSKDLQEKLRVAEGEMEEIKQQNTTFFHENQKLKEKQVSLQEQTKDLQEKLRVAKEEKKEFEDKVHLLQTGTMELQRAQDRQALEITSAQAELAAVVEDKIKLQKEKEEFERSLDNLRISNKKLNVEVSLLKKQITLLETQSSCIETELCQPEKRLSQVQSQQKELEDLQRKGQDKTRHLEQLKEENNQLNANFFREQNLKEELKEKILLLQTLQKEIDEKEKENQCLRRENEGLLAHLPEMIHDAPSGLLTQSQENTSLLYGNPYLACPEIPDADLVSVKKCPMCNDIFSDLEEQQYADHVRSHLLDCPYCCETFDKSNKQVYDDHVYCHGLDKCL